MTDKVQYVLFYLKHLRTQNDTKLNNIGLFFILLYPSEPPFRMKHVNANSSAFKRIDPHPPESFRAFPKSVSCLLFGAAHRQPQGWSSGCGKTAGFDAGCESPQGEKEWRWTSKPHLQTASSGLETRVHVNLLV